MVCSLSIIDYCGTRFGLKAEGLSGERLGNDFWGAAGNRSGSIWSGKIPREPWSILGMAKFALFPSRLSASSVLRPIAYEDALPFRLESFTRLTQYRWA